MSIDHGIDKTETEQTRLKEQQNNLKARAEKWQKNYEEYLKPAISSAVVAARCEVERPSAVNGTSSEQASYLRDPAGLGYMGHDDDNNDNDDEDQGGEEGVELVVEGSKKRKRKDEGEEKGKAKASAKAKAPGTKDITELRTAVVAVEIILPSCTTASVLNQECMRKAKELELELRKGHASEVLDLLRKDIITKMALTQGKEKLTGHDYITRGNILIRKKAEDINFKSAAYRRSYEAMKVLGFSGDNVHRELKKGDLKTLPMGFDHTDTRLEVEDEGRAAKRQKTGKGKEKVSSYVSQSKERVSWIWNDLGFLNGPSKQDEWRTYTKEGE